MKQLCYVFLALLMISVIGCRRNRAERLYERFQEDSGKIEFIIPPEDTVVLEDEDMDPAKWDEEEGLMAIPDIPQERRVNMSANDYELEKMMKGK
jgi:hypothetical protein